MTETIAENIQSKIYELGPDWKSIYRSQAFIENLVKHTTCPGVVWRLPHVENTENRGVGFVWKNGGKTLRIVCTADDYYAELYWHPKDEDPTDLFYTDGMRIGLGNILHAAECYHWIVGSNSGRPNNFDNYDYNIISSEWNNDV